MLVDPAFYADEGEDAVPVGLLGSEADGGFATYVAVDAVRVHDMTASPLSDEELAALPVAYGTAMGMLERARIMKGEAILVTGASGGVGFALVQLAAARGARVVALTSGTKAEVVRDAGAEVTVSRDMDPAEFHRELRAAAPGGLDAVADVAGGPWLERVLPALRDGARWVIAARSPGPWSRSTCGASTCTISALSAPRCTPGPISRNWRNWPAQAPCGHASPPRIG